MELEIEKCLKRAGVFDEKSLCDNIIEAILSEGLSVLSKFRERMEANRFADLKKDLNSNSNIVKYRPM